MRTVWLCFRLCLQKQQRQQWHAHSTHLFMGQEATAAAAQQRQHPQGGLLAAGVLLKAAPGRTRLGQDEPVGRQGKQAAAAATLWWQQQRSSTGRNKAAP